MKDIKSIKKIDIHSHASKRVTIPRIDGSHLITADELLAMYDQLGVEKSVLLPIVSCEAQYQVISCEETMEIVEAHPDRFYWFCNIDPRALTYTTDANFSHMLNYYKSRGAKGVGELTSNVYFDDPLTMNLFAHCEACDMPVTFHIGDKGGDYGLIDEIGLPRLENALKAFPKLRFFGHSQKFWAEIGGDLTPEEDCPRAR